MKEKYHALNAKLTPYIICKEDIWLNSKQYGITFDKRTLFFDPLKVKDAFFINSIQKLDSLSFGGQSMGMEKWVLFDCAMVPGFVFGYAIEVDKLSESDQGIIGKKHSLNEFFPLSMYIAIPTISGDWFGHNLSSLNSLLSEELSGLGLFTKAMAMSCFNIKKLLGATQWDSNALSLHLKFGPLKLLSAFTPNHSKEESLCYQCETINPLMSLADDQKYYEPELELKNDTASWKHIQKLIEEEKKDIYLLPETNKELIRLSFQKAKNLAN